jgi:hypothetical protein
MPGTHVNADSEAVRVNLLSSPNVYILCGSGRCRMEARVVRGQLATECCRVLSGVIGMKRSLTIHSASNFTGLLVAPPDGSKISLIVHEATVEEWLHIWTGRGDVDLRK